MEYFKDMEAFCHKRTENRKNFVRTFQRKQYIITRKIKKKGRTKGLWEQNYGKGSLW